MASAVKVHPETSTAKGVGLFPACFRVSRNLAGGETATFKWLVNAMHKTVSGTGRLTQAVNPPTDITVEMTGSYVDAEGGIFLQAAGSMPGASIQVVLMLKSWGDPGEAVALNWLANNHHFSDKDVPAKPMECFG